METRFSQVEDEFFRLKGQLAAGRITREQFEAGQQSLTLQDAGGRQWRFGGESAKWYVYDGTKWVEANPESSASIGASPQRPTELPESSSPPRPGRPPNMTPPPPTQATASRVAPPPAKKGGMSCGGCLVTGCLVIVLLIIVVGVGGFLAIRSGAITPQAALSFYLNATGQGPADIEVDNFRDDAIDVSVRRTDASQDSGAVQKSLTLNAFDVKTYHAPGPGKYLVSFGPGGSGGSGLGTCTLTVHGGDHYQFVALPDKIAVNRVNNPSSVGTDFVIDSSSLCR